MRSIILSPDVDVLVSSFGGVGTTFLMDFIARYKTVNSIHDRDDLKHSGLPPLCSNPHLKRIYVFGNVCDAVQSIFRRGFQHGQSIKLQLHVRTPIDPIQDGCTVEDYLAKGLERLCLAEHFTNYHDRFVFHNTLFIRYETLFDHIPEIMDFLDIPAECIRHFPEKRERQSRIHSQSFEQGITRMYGGLIDRLESMPDISIVNPNQTISHPSAAVLLTPYRRCMWLNLKERIDLSTRRFRI